MGVSADSKDTTERQRGARESSRFSISSKAAWSVSRIAHKKIMKPREQTIKKQEGLSLISRGKGCVVHSVREMSAVVPHPIQWRPWLTSRALPPDTHALNSFFRFPWVRVFAQGHGHVLLGRIGTSLCLNTMNYVWCIE